MKKKRKKLKVYTVTWTGLGQQFAFIKKQGKKI
jgi:hypothetical protein